MRTGEGWGYEATLSVGDSAARCTAPPGADEYHVLQQGERRLWDEAEAAYRWWLRRGLPGRERFGLDISEGRSRVWLDDPSAPVSV
ncbi:hypothetical protein [Actinomadura litoris]|uniref:hypothetical protein n=1 Tax=Actinomadura litoris TaxID=2678616 RepID=UPI001FA7B62E|nr:hypothetical protein [Actinomadura litoris]